jgi:hypothetical protein
MWRVNVANPLGLITNPNGKGIPQVLGKHRTSQMWLTGWRHADVSVSFRRDNPATIGEPVGSRAGGCTAGSWEIGSAPDSVLKACL